jgi:hypothetical protein
MILQNLRISPSQKNIRLAALTLSLLLLITFSVHAAPEAPPAPSASPAKSNVVDLSVAETPEEFRCEPIENTDFDQVNESMASLKKTLNEALDINDTCVTTSLATPENHKNMNALVDKIRGGVGILKGQLKNSYVENISSITTGSVSSEQAYAMTAQDQKQAKEAVVVVVGAMKELNTIIDSNPLKIDSSRSCKTHYSSSERLVFGVAEFVENVSPVLIQAVSKIPGLQELAPLVVGASMVSSAITQYAETAQKRVDIGKVENRTAILVNSCQLVKTYQKMQFLRGLRTNPEEEKLKLEQKIKTQTSLLSQNLSQKVQITDARIESQWMKAIDQQNRNFQSLSTLKNTISGDSNAVCEAKNQVIDLTSSVTATHQLISEISNQAGSLQDEIFMDRINRYRQSSLVSPQSLENCQRNVKSLFEFLQALNRRTFQILMDFKMMKMAQRPSIVRASGNLDFLRSFQDLLNQMSTENLFQKLQASIYTTDSMVQQSRVLKAWFGNAKKFYWPGDEYRNPVMDLMNHYERQFLVLRSSFMKGSATFEYNLYQLYQYWHPKKSGQTEKAYIADFNKYVSESLDILNPLHLDSKNVSTVSGRSSPHQKACSSLLSMRSNYRTMMDSWSTLRYFCQMLTPVLMEPEISAALRNRCLGVDDLVPNSPRAKLSGVDQLLEPVNLDVRRMPRILEKIKELKCTAQQ